MINAITTSLKHSSPYYVIITAIVAQKEHYIFLSLE